MSLSLYFHTIKFLKPVQIYGRILHHLKRPLVRAVVKNNVTVKLPPQALTSFPLNSIKMKGPMNFHFLNVTAALPEGQSWSAETRTQLWNYHLHYFDDLNAQDFSSRRSWHLQYIERWIEENPAGLGDGWLPYPLSLRIANWIKAHLNSPLLNEKALQSLYQQASFLNSTVEYHLLGNHLFVNGKALFMAGLFFGEKEWLFKGQKIVSEGLEQQVLADGAHFELSPMYHALFVEDVLDIEMMLKAYRRPLLASAQSKIPLMLKFLRAMTFPNGELASFNDTAQNIAKSTDSLLSYAQDLGHQCPEQRSQEFFKEAGLVRLTQGESVLIFDNGPLGPDFLLAHAHADNLSFELFTHGKKCLCNLGISQYGQTKAREQERATAAHNTVEVDGENSSQVWQGFRVAKRARPLSLEMNTSHHGELSLRASHDGYSRLPRPVLHQRHLTWKKRELDIVDELSGAGQHQARSFIHVHPAWKSEVSADKKAVSLKDKEGHEVKLFFSHAVNSRPSFYHAEFGHSEATHSLELAQNFKERGTFSLRIELCAST